MDEEHESSMQDNWFIDSVFSLQEERRYISEVILDIRKEPKIGWDGVHEDMWRFAGVKNNKYITIEDKFSEITNKLSEIQDLMTVFYAICLGESK